MSSDASQKLLQSIDGLAKLAPDIEPNDAEALFGRSLIVQAGESLGVDNSDRLPSPEIWRRILAIITNRTEIGQKAIVSENRAKRRAQPSVVVEVTPELIRQRQAFEKLRQEVEQKQHIVPPPPPRPSKPKLKKPARGAPLAALATASVLSSAALNQHQLAPPQSPDEDALTRLVNQRLLSPPVESKSSSRKRGNEPERKEFDMQPEPQAPFQMPAGLSFQMGSSSASRPPIQMLQVPTRVEKRGRGEGRDDEGLVPPLPPPPFEMPQGLSFQMGVRERPKFRIAPAAPAPVPKYVLSPWMKKNGGLLEELDWATVKSALEAIQEDYQTVLPREFLRVTQDMQDWLPKLERFNQSLMEAKEPPAAATSLFMYLTRLQAQRGKYLALIRLLEQRQDLIPALKAMANTPAYQCLLQLKHIYDLSMAKAHLYYDMLSGLYPDEVIPDLEEQLAQFDREGQSQSAAFMAQNCWSSVPE